MCRTSVGLFKTRSMECTSVFCVSFNVNVVLHVCYVHVRPCEVKQTSEKSGRMRKPSIVIRKTWVVLRD